MTSSKPRIASLKRARFCLFVTLCSPLIALAQIAPPRPVYTPPPDAVSFGSMLQVVFSLLLVLGAVVLVAWLLKRINMPQHGAASLLKVISGVAVGQRERIVLIEVKDIWLVVGVAPGQVRILHSMPKSDIPAQPAGAPSDTDVKNFQSWLKQMAEKRNAG
jgi:flagellar protein FliO/FliZ